MASTSSPASPSRKVTLLSSDEEIFDVDINVASLSVTLKHMMEDLDGGSGKIPLPNVNGKTLAKVIEYCCKHVKTPETDAEKGSEILEKWDKDFVNTDINTLFDLILAANYMDIKCLLGLISQELADRIKDMSVEDVRKIFNITNDFSPEEEAAIRKENEWAFQ